AHALDLPPVPAPTTRHGRRLERQELGDVGDALLNRLRRDPVLLVVGELLGAAPIRLVERALDGLGQLVGVHQQLAVRVPLASAIFLVRVVTSTRSPTSSRRRTSFRRSSIWFFVARSSTSGSTIPVGRISCSAIRVDCRSSYGPGVAETKTICGTFSRYSSKRSGRLSSADGSRKP